MIDGMASIKKMGDLCRSPIFIARQKIAACGSSYMGPVQELPQAAII